MPKKRLKGTIVSNKMKDTVVVKVDRIKEHSKYKRRYKISKKYKADTKKFELGIGDQVVIQECKPKSKDKHWRVIETIKTKNNDSTTDNIKSS